MTLAIDLAKESERAVAVLRVSTTALAIILETRERLAEIVQRWLPVHGEEKPVRLTELSDFLGSGFFGISHIEKTMEGILEQANDLGLFQIMADTVYESLDRELPGAIARNKSLHPRQNELRKGQRCLWVNHIIVGRSSVQRTSR